MDESDKLLPKRRKRGAPLGNERALSNRGGGRKTVYSPRMAVVARKCCQRGMIDIEVADMLGIGLATLYRWKAEHPAFSRVFKLGKAEADDRVERSLYSRAIGYDYIAEKAAMTRHGQKTMRYRQHIPPDTAAAVWYLKNRRPDRWRDSFSPRAHRIAIRPHRRHRRASCPPDQTSAGTRSYRAAHYRHNAKGAKLGTSGKLVRSPANARNRGQA